MYLLKQILEDFIVREISSTPTKSSGKYLYYKLKKKNQNTLDAVTQLAKALRIKWRK